MDVEQSLLDPAWPAAHSAALNRASQRLKPTRVDLVSENNWASTYRIAGRDATAYLKIVPASQRVQLGAALLVAERFPECVPRVLEADREGGWMLAQDHGGRNPFTEDPDELPLVAQRFGQLQSIAARDPDFLARFATVDASAMLAALFSFLEHRTPPDAAAADRVGADYFIGEADAQRYLRLLVERAPLLRAQVALAAALPPTLGHGDLHRRNVALRDDGSVVFYDWDDVAVGPAGLCLHGLFGGCALATVALSRMAAGVRARRTPEARRLHAYVKALVDGGYADRRALLAGLAGSMCAGQMRFIATFGRFPGAASREDSADTLSERLSDLLDLCDWLVCSDESSALASADAYERGHEWRRAQRIVQDQLARHPRRVDLLLRYAELSRRIEDHAAAEEAYREAIARGPDRVGPRVELARLLLERLDLRGSSAALRPALARKSAAPQARAVLARVRKLEKIRKVAASRGGWPRVEVSAAEHERGRLDPDTRGIIHELYRQNGAVQIDNLHRPERIAQLQTAFFEKYRAHFHDGTHPDAMQVGDKRYMLTVEIDEQFGAPEMIASPLVMPLMHGLLGEDCILSAYTAVVSLPGSADQFIHRDHTALFEEAGPDLDCPPFATQIILPLVPLNEMTGATRVYKRSQHLRISEAEKTPHQDPVVPLGSCLLTDYLVAHHGMGNRSDIVRPILTMIYARPWFRDYHNYRLQPPLRLAPGYLDRAPDQIHKLVDWWDLERRIAARAS